MSLLSRLTVNTMRVDGNGTKQFGIVLWGNASRVGLQFNFWAWETQIMVEKNYG